MPAPIYLPQSNWGTDFASAINASLSPLLQLLHYKQLQQAAGLAADKAQQPDETAPGGYWQPTGASMPPMNDYGAFPSSGAPPSIFPLPGGGMAAPMSPEAQANAVSYGQGMAQPFGFQQFTKGQVAGFSPEGRERYAQGMAPYEPQQPDWLKKINYLNTMSEKLGKPLDWQHLAKAMGIDTKTDEAAATLDYLKQNDVPVNKDTIAKIFGTYIDPSYQLVTDDAGNLKLVSTGGPTLGKVTPIKGAKGKSKEVTKENIEDLLIPIVKKVLRGDKLTPQEKEFYDAKVLKTGMWEQLLQAAGIGTLGIAPSMPRTADEYERMMK